MKTRLLWLFLCLLSLGAQAQTGGRSVVTVDLENESVRRFLDEVVYTIDSDSRVSDFFLPGVEAGKPVGVPIEVPVYGADTLYSTRTDTLVVTRTDTLVQTVADTLYYVTTGEGIVDTLITQRTDSIITKSTTTTISIVCDTLVTIPEDTLLLCYSLRDDYVCSDTLRLANGTTSLLLYNLMPQREYFYKIETADSVLAEGEIHTLGRVRMIHVPSVMNVRDMGGWMTTDNKRVRYGKIFRGAELNGTHVADSIDLATLRRLGIGAELDLRAWYNEGHNTSAFAFLDAEAVGEDEVPTYLYTDDSGQLPEHMTNYIYTYRWKKEFEYIVDNLKEGNAVYQHCVWGRDRTGYLSLLLEGVLGLSYSDLVKEYELSCFAYGRNSVIKTKSIDQVMQFIESMSGLTLRDKFVNYFVRYLNVSTDDIEFFRQAMLDKVYDEEQVDGLQAPQQQASAALREVYDLSGHKVSSVGKNALYIVKESDGSVSKLVGR